MLQSLKELLFPVHCFGCGAIGIEICSKCRRHWNPHFFIRKIQELTVYSSIQYSPVAKSILLSAKEDSIRIADELIISALQDCFRRLPSTLLRNAILIPIPGSNRAVRRRGRDFIEVLTRELSLRTGVPYIQGINVQRRLLDQSELSSVDRHRNIRGAFAPIIHEIPPNSNVILVDDLVTTGATLLEGRRALNAAGITCNRAITACLAQSPKLGA